MLIPLLTVAILPLLSTNVTELSAATTAAAVLVYAEPEPGMSTNVI